MRPDQFNKDPVLIDNDVLFPQKITSHYQQPMDNVSQNGFSSLSYTQDISMKDAYQEEDFFLEK